VYGSGTSERIVGKALQGRRDELVVATKVAPSPEGSGFRPEQVRAACDASLGRLGIDAIDLYQLHWPDESGVPLDDTWGAMAELVEAGKVRHAGVSNFDQQMLEACEAIRHVDSLQQEFSMLALEDRALIRWCGEHGIGVVTYSPLGVGFLTGRYTREEADSIDDWRSGDAGWTSSARLDQVFRVVDGLRPIAERLGMTMGQLALAWNVAQPGVTAAIAGSRSGSHTRENAQAGDITLDDETLQEIEALL
jgi:aryl-alcohol dehydrogenase-like predicted oxidoreductase